MVAQLQGRYQCLTYDLRGFGHSCSDLAAYEVGIPAPAQRLGATYHPFGLAAYARDLETLLRQLNLPGPVWLVGHSLGASIALWTAYCYPEKVQGVICINAGGGIYLKRDFDRFRRAGQQIVRFRPPWLRYLPFIDLLFTRMMVAQPLQRQWGRQRLQDLLLAHPDAALGTLLESTTEEEIHLLPRIVSQLQQPVYFLAGVKDTVMELKFVRYMASFHALFEADFDSGEGNVIELPECGHMAMLECPNQVIAATEEIIHRHAPALPVLEGDSRRPNCEV
jgi:pimeloyl-ACP methyl ester carboxylesterase